MKTEKFAFDPTKIDAFFHRAALMVLLKAKAKAILAELPEVERTVFNDNCSGANRPVTLAKCLVKLFRIRDSLKEKDQNMPVAPFLGLFTFFKDLLSISQSQERSMSTRHQMPVKFVNKARSRTNNIAHQNGWTVLNRPIKIEHNRAARSIETRRKDVPKNIANLHKLQRYMSMAQEYNNYMQKMVKHNYRYLKSVSPLTNSKFELHDDSMWSVEQLGTEVQNILQASGVDPRKFSILSPKILSVFSNKNEQHEKMPGLLSPELLSFQNNTGLFSLPQLLGVAVFGQKETLEWLDLMLEMTGAGRSIQTLLNRSASQMKQLEEKLYPSILKQKVVDRRWEILRSSLTPASNKLCTPGVTLFG